MVELQEAVGNAFEWVNGVYREGELLLSEVAEQLTQLGFSDWDDPERKWGKDTTYLLSQCFGQTEHIEAPTGIGVFVGVSFYPDKAKRRGSGPRLLFGTVEWVLFATSKTPAALNGAARAPGEDEWFRVTSKRDDALVTCEPTEKGRREYPWIARVQSIALPLTAIRTPDHVADVVRAMLALLEGDDALGRALVARFPS